MRFSNICIIRYSTELLFHNLEELVRCRTLMRFADADQPHFHGGGLALRRWMLLKRQTYSLKTNLPVSPSVN